MRLQPAFGLLLAALGSVPVALSDVITRIPDAAPPGYEQWTSEVVLPAKPVSGDGEWAGAVARARAFVGKLTLEEKINVTTGTDVLTRCVGNTGTIPRFGWKGLCLEDSPLGVRFADFVSAFPAAINVAATWDKDLIYARGKAMGEEFRGKGVNVALGPMTNLARIPTAGRNWEGFGADPFLSGVGSVQTVKGHQDVGVIATIKHYIANEQEHFRGGSQAAQIVSSNLDDRTMHELYLWPFAEAVRAGVGAMMCSYQKVNQTQACQNSKILNGIFKEELDFQGFIMSDWAAAINGVQPALAGMDMNMPGFRAYGQGPQDEANPVIATNGWWGANLLEAVRNGSVPEARVDDMVTRTFAAWYKLGQDSGYPDVNFNQVTQDTYYNGQLLNEHINVQGDHYKLIREIGGASTVLLKNVNGALPLSLSKIRRIGVFGSDAGPNPDGPNGCGDRGCNQGTLAMGWGSGTTNFPYLIDPAAAIVDYVRTNKNGVVVEPVLTDSNYAAVDRVSPYADTCLVFVNADSGEGYITVEGNAGDRNDLLLWHNGDALIQRVASQCANTIVTMHTVGAVIVEPWIDHPNVTAVLSAGLPGQETGNAIVDVLFGAVNPSARLPYTIAKSAADYNTSVIYASSETTPQQTYSEGLEIDYRHFDAEGITPRFEFGFGLSYTSFAYSGLSVRGGQYRRQADPTVVSSSVASATPAPESSTLASSGPIPSATSESISISEPVSSTLSTASSATLSSVISSAFSSGFSSAPSAPSSGFSSAASSGFSSAASSGYSSGLSSAASSTINATATATGSAPPVVSSPVQTTPGGPAALWDVLFTVSYTVQNTGNHDGSEVSQVYLGFPKSTNEPPRVLRGFARTKLRCGQRDTVSVTLRRKDVSIWDVVTQKWVVPKGTFKVEVGSSSRKIHLTGTFQT